MDNEDLNDQDEKLRNLMGLGSSSIRKSYYPELQNKINELNVEKERFERIFSDALNGIFQSDLLGKIIIANPAMVSLCGYYTLEDLQSFENIGVDLFAENILLEELLNSISESGSVMGYETQFKTSD